MPRNKNERGTNMIIYGDTLTTWKNKAKIYWADTNKFAFSLFVIWSVILFLL